MRHLRLSLAGLLIATAAALSLATSPSASAQSSSLRISKTDNTSETAEGDTLRYIIRIQNTSDTAQTVTVRDFIPTSTDYVSASDGGSRSGNEVLWRNITVARNNSRELLLWVRVRTDLRDNTIIRNTARIDSTGTIAEDTTRVRVDDDRECSDGRDNDRDGDIDYPEDAGCTSRSDDSEDPDVGDRFECDDDFDNDRDGDTDFPDDEGCDSRTDDTEDTDPKERQFQCYDGRDNDGDSHIDYPDDLGCANRTDRTEDSERLTRRTACRDGKDNDKDGYVDYPDDPGCTSRDDNEEYDSTSSGTQDDILRVQKDVDRREAQPGDLVRYTIRVTNTGARDLVNAILDDTYQSGELKILNIAPMGTATTHGVRWPLGTIRRGEQKTLAYDARLSANLRHGDVVTNTASVRETRGLVVSDTAQVMILQRLPQTGFFDGFAGGTSSFVRPITRRDAGPSGSPMLPLAATVITGALAGIVSIRRFIA
ncbi:MAG: SD repeat-containing cell surface protein [Candidatus Peregrinibacteria bacterium Gr01-1014_25]|nr:MAG: SD repeat-containing cell surface protein [Candidatus Peregrinibacteria bacterium Gr01-1014_25]